MSKKTNTTANVSTLKRTATLLVKKAVAANAPKGSQKAAAVAIYATGVSRSEGIARYVNDLGMSSATASTYWQNIRSGKWA